MNKLLITLLTFMVTHGAFATASNDDATSKLYVDTTVATRQDAVPANNANTVMTYTDTAGTVGTKGIYDATGSYAEQQNALVPADVANAAIMNAINMEFECAEWNPNDDTDCWKWRILNPVNPSRNLFDINRVPNVNWGTKIVNNYDGTITVTGMLTNTAVITRLTLSELVPDLVVGNTYTLSLQSEYHDREEITLIYGTDSNRIVYRWLNGNSRTITQTDLDSIVYFQAPTSMVPINIWDIQIEEGTVATPYQPYGENTYLPQNQQ